MNIRKTFVYLLILCIKINVFGEVINKYYATNDTNFTLILFVCTIDGTNRLDDSMYYSIIASTNVDTFRVFKNIKIYIPKDEYYFQHNLYDSDGNKMPNTKEGNRYGKYFNKHIPPVEMRSWRNKESLRYSIITTNSDIEPNIIRLPTFNQFYKIEKAGKYYLSIQIRMIYCNYELTEHSVLNNSKEIKYRTLDSKGFKDIIFPEVKIPIVIDKIDNN